MNKKMKRRMVAVTGVIIIVLILVLAVAGGGNVAKSVTVADVADGSYEGQKVQITGTVVDDSFETTNGVLTFFIYDPEGNPEQQVKVRFDGGVSATFGSGVIAICTGTMEQDNTLSCVNLVTKCPSKYENATDALTVDQLFEYGDGVIGKPVKVAAIAVTVNAVSEDARLVVASDSGLQMSVVYDGALSEDIAEGAAVVLSGSLDANGSFMATDVALQS